MASGAAMAIYESSHFLNASLSFSPACLTLPFTWSALPSACSLSLPLALPTVSFSFPFACWAVFFALSVVVMVGLLVLGCEKGDGHFCAGLHTGSPWQEPDEPEAENDDDHYDENADRHRFRAAAVTQDTEEYGRDDGRPDGCGQLLYRTQGTARASSFLVGDVAEGDFIDRTEAGTHPSAENEE